MISTKWLVQESIGIPRVKEDHAMNRSVVLVELPLIKGLPKDNKKRQRTSDRKLMMAVMMAFCLLFR